MSDAASAKRPTTTNTTESLDELLKEQQAKMWFNQSYADVCTHKSTYDGLTAQDIVDKSVEELAPIIQQEVLRGRLDTAKQIENETGAKFDELCRRVHAEPTFGSTPKHKKENFMDGAESMILVPTIHKNKLQDELNTLLGGENDG